MRRFMARRDNGRLIFMAAFASAGLLGAGTALLLAPQSGKKTRQLLTQLGSAAQKGPRRIQSNLNRKMDHLIVDLRENLRSGMNNGKGWARHTRGEIVKVLKTGKRQLGKEVDRILHS